MKCAQVILFCLLAGFSWVSAKPGDKTPPKEKKEKKDLEPAETRVPLLPYGEPLGGPILPGSYEPSYPIRGPLGYVDDRIGGISEEALNYGNRGDNYYRGGNDGHYTDGLYHEDGRYQDGGYQGSEGYKDNKHHIADDHASKAYYNGVHGTRKDYGNGEVFDKSQGYAQNAYNTLGGNELNDHNKGHHKTGFKKSYHKDESGHDESYYDSDHDQGNHERGQKYGDQLGVRYGTSLSGGHKLNEFDAHQQGRNGYEGNGKLVALNHGLKDYYGRNGYYNSGNKYGSLGSGQAANYGKYGSQYGYLNDYNNGRNYGGYYGSRYGNGYYP